MQAVCAKCSRLMCRAVVLFLVAECAQTTPMIAPLPGDPNFSIDGSVAFFKSGESNPTQPNPPTHRAQGNQDGVRDGDRGSTRVGETPRKRVGARGRGRGRARGWHTRVTVLLRGQTYRQGRQREGEWEGRQAREGAQGSGTGVARRRAGGTRRARGSSGEREHGTRKNNSRTGAHTGRTHRGGRAREVGGTGGQQGHKGTQCLSQRSTMPMTRIEPYRLPRPTIRELMEGRLAGEDDGGVPPKGCLGRVPRSAYRSEDRAEAQRRVRAREIQTWRGDDQRRADRAGEQH